MRTNLKNPKVVEYFEKNYEWMDYANMKTCRLRPMTILGHTNMFMHDFWFASKFKSWMCNREVINPSSSTSLGKLVLGVHFCALGKKNAHVHAKEGLIVIVILADLVGIRMCTLEFRTTTCINNYQFWTNLANVHIMSFMQQWSPLWGYHHPMSHPYIATKSSLVPCDPPTWRHVPRWDVPLALLSRTVITSLHHPLLLSNLIHWICRIMVKLFPPSKFVWNRLVHK